MKKEKVQLIFYWVFTAWLALGMLSTGIVQTLQVKEDIAFMLHLGYPTYFLTILGVCKILGAIVVLLPRLTLLKEWAYAGFFFTMAGAFTSHLVCGSPAHEVFPSILLLVLTMLSWYLRPASRRIIQAKLQ